jgi:hypothetical protein
MGSIVRDLYGETVDSRGCIGSLWILEPGNAISVRVGEINLTLEVRHMLVEGDGIRRHGGFRSDFLVEVAKAVFSTDQCRIILVDSGLTGAGCDIAYSNADAPLARTIRR